MERSRSDDRAAPTTSTLTNDEFGSVAAFLEERDLMVEVFKDALDLISYLESYWQSHRENGERAPQTIIAQGKLFAAIHQVHKKNLRRRILEVRDRFDRAEARYMKAHAKGKKQ